MESVQISEKKPACIDKTCLDCIYLGIIFNSKSKKSVNGKYCDYLLRTGMSRGCPAGKGCTQKVRKKKK